MVPSIYPNGHANGSAMTPAQTDRESQDDVHESTKEGNGQLKDTITITKGRWESAVETFAPIWYTVSMNTGILSILYHQLPYGARWLRICSTIMFIFNIIIFTTVTLIHLIRLCRYPKSWLRQTSDPQEACMWACAPIALFTISAQIGLTVSQASWGGHPWTIVAYVFWWFNQTWMFSMGPIIYTFLMKSERFRNGPVLAAIVLAPVGTATASVVGATIITYSADVSPRLAVPVIIWGYMLLGIGGLLGLLAYAVILSQLFRNGIPPGAAVVSMFLLIGPAGQVAAGLQFHGAAARRDFGGYDKGTFLTMMSGESLDAAAVLLALLFIGIDIFFLVFALYAVLEKAFQRQLSYSMVWWSTIFPCGTLTLAFLSLSTSLDSPTFRVLTTGLTIILTVDYFFNWYYTLRNIFNGSLLDGRELLKEMEEERLKENQKED